MIVYITPNQNGFDCNLVKDEISQRRIQLEQMSLIELSDELENLFSDVFGNYEIKILENRMEINNYGNYMLW